MLLGLKIENIAVIESAFIEFKQGLNVLTGETGAGKSIVIDSINAVLGERTSKELIRDGTDSAKVVARFSNISRDADQLLELYDIDKTEDGELTISRTININGKNSCKINGCSVTVSQLKEIGSRLINIHGQHDSQALLSPDKHCGFIDIMADNEELLNNYKTAFADLIKVKHELDRLYDTRDEKTARLDYLEYVIKEISQAEIKSGETEELNGEKLLLENSVKVRQLIDKVYGALSGDNGISRSLMECAESLAQASHFYKDATSTAESFKSMAFELEDSLDSVKKLSDDIVYSPERLGEINDRLDMIYRLSMKYGKTEEDILTTLSNAVTEKNEIAISDEKIKSLEHDLYICSDRVKTLSEKLTLSRYTAAQNFEKSVSSELSFLDMPYVDFKVSIKKTPLTSKGAESIEFLISTNPGQVPKPISKIASGGELSRIMLAIKNVLTYRDTVGTLIFDEIDAGVSGSAADKIAKTLYRVSKDHQVICVTHLARIAAQADCHFKIVKEYSGDSTHTRVITLNENERAVEIARITAGNDITELQIKSADEMLKNAKE